jgi:RNA polymerase sigma factor (sigma-70 family)
MREQQEDRNRAFHVGYGIGMTPLKRENSDGDRAVWLGQAVELVRSLYDQSQAQKWGLSPSQFASALERSVQKRFADGDCSAGRLEEYLSTLHVADLALACACMQGSESAWESFVREYRGYLRASAGAITKDSRTGTDARELADSLFAELFGLDDRKRGEHSLFRYFHGRSSLKTWLRTVLLQRHIDRLRESKRWEPLENKDGGNQAKQSDSGGELRPHLMPDPHREKYVGLFVEALDLCVGALEKQDRLRVEFYYARQMTLAEIGQKLREHESSVSRNLDRIRRDLRLAIEEHLRGDANLSEAECMLCMQYAAEDAPIDFRKMFPEKDLGKATGGRKGTL